MPKNKPTDVQIRAEANRLFEMKPKVLQFSGFGDDHHAAIDAQFLVIQDFLGDQEDFFDERAIEDYAETHGWAENVTSAAREMFQWLEGDEENAPSKDWESLIRK
jgi:hypothetical protein